MSARSGGIDVTILVWLNSRLLILVFVLFLLLVVLVCVVVYVFPYCLLTLLVFVLSRYCYYYSSYCSLSLLLLCLIVFWGEKFICCAMQTRMIQNHHSCHHVSPEPCDTPLLLIYSQSRQNNEPVFHWLTKEMVNNEHSVLSNALPSANNINILLTDRVYL